MKTKILFTVLSILTALVLLGCPNPVTPPKDTVIYIAAISGVTAPVKGATPVTTITENDQYTGTVAWNDSPTSFTLNTVYTATITLSAKAGYTLDGVEENFFKVSGATSNTNPANSGVVTAVFPMTKEATVNITAILGVKVPITGETPVTNITETDQYTGTVVWNDNPKTFFARIVYTATITLTAKTGYTLDGVTENFFTVAEATSVTNSSNSGVVTVQFPTTTEIITIASIPGVTAPVAGATPVTAIIPTDQYIGTVSWIPADASFKAGTVYTATISLTPFTGYTLEGLADNFFTLEDATTVTYVPNSNLVTAIFINLPLVSVPAGSFQRSDTPTDISEITKPYYMSQHEISRAQFLAVMSTDPSNTFFSSSNIDPVQSINWYHAIVFCNKLSIIEGLTPVYSVTGVDFGDLIYEDIPTMNNLTWNDVTCDWNATGYRLPTQMEWKWAAMGATFDRSFGYTGIGRNTTGYTKTFAGSTGSNIYDDYAWYDGNNGGTSHPVGTKLPNELGLFDMSGNVNVWSWDWTGSYTEGTLTDYHGPVSSSARTTCGSSLSGASSSGAGPYHNSFSLGLRVVRQ